MILFFQSSTKTVLAVEAAHAFSPEDTQKLVRLFSEATPDFESQKTIWAKAGYVRATPGNDYPVEYERR